MKFNVDDLVEKGLVKKKTYTEGIYKGLSVLKYSRKVFFDNLWHLDERLLECRGIVVGENDNVIVLPFKKVFNLGENDTQVDPELMVTCPRKVNGFMAAATLTDKYGLIVSTTGTLDSEFAVLARKWIEKGKWGSLWTGRTYLFEICDPSDPHIVDEDAGEYLIGCRFVTTGEMLSEEDLELESLFLNYKRPEVLKCTFKDLPLAIKHEGYMVRDSSTGETLCKIKSNYYLVKKALIRMGKNRSSLMFNNPLEFRKQIDEEFYDLHKYILDNYTLEQYTSFNQEERRNIFDNYFKKD